MRLKRHVPLLLALAIAACGGAGNDAAPDPAPEASAEIPPQETPGADGELDLEPPPAPDDNSSPAVNSVTVDPGDGTILVGSGPAMFIVRPGEKEGERILGVVETPAGKGTVSGNMVLRFTGPGELLANGHPRQGNLPENLPLLRSSDLGKTFTAVPGAAEADYHELEVFGDRIFAVGVESPDIQVSSDGGQTWATSTPPNLPIDIVVDPGDADHWAVSTEQGTFVSTNGGQSWRPRDTASGARLAWPAADTLYSLDRNGRLRVSADGGESWKDRGDAGGLPSEFTVDAEGALYVAVVGGKIRKSGNGGKSWSTVATLR